jgi:NodT family efflux transporter outer membrane factor (OMF) lipoprotein
MVDEGAEHSLARAAKLRRSLFRLARRLRAERPTNGLSPNKRVVLFHLWREGPKTPGDLAAAEYQQPQTLTRVFADLQKAGLVKRSPNPQDRRQAVIELTQEGRLAIESDLQRVDAWLATALNELGDTERQVLEMSADIMDKLVADRPARRGQHSSGAARAIATAVVGATLLGGCVLDWDKPTFDVPVAAMYRARKTTEAPPVADRWAATFGSHELADLADAALVDNLDIAAAVARITQADAQARIATSGLFPTIGFQGDASRTQTPGTLTSKTPPFTATRRDLFTLGLNASYTIDFWGKVADASGAARLNADASRFDRRVIALSTVASVVNTYLQLLGSQDRLRIARDNVRIATTVLDAINQRVKAGTATALDQAQQETVVATQRANIPPLEQSVQQSRNLIAVLVGRTPEAFLLKGGSLDRLKTPHIQPGLPSELLERRPDVAEAQYKVLAQGLNTESARAAFFPSLTLTGQYGVQSIVLKNLLRPEAIAYEVAGQLLQPIFDGWLLQGQYEFQKGSYAELLALYQKQILTAFSDVENALVAVAQTTEHERLQAQAVAAARRAYDVSIIRLKEGTIDIVTLSTTQTQLFSNQDLLSQTRLTRFQAYVQLYQALGGGWDDVKRELATIDEAQAHTANLGPWP